jgi:hypothetical protein
MMELDEYLLARPQISQVDAAEELVLGAFDIELEQIQFRSAYARDQFSWGHAFDLICRDRVMENIGVITADRATLVLTAFVKPKASALRTHSDRKVGKASVVHSDQRFERRRVLAGGIDSICSHAVPTHQVHGEIRLVAATYVGNLGGFGKSGEIKEIRGQVYDALGPEVAQAPRFSQVAPDPADYSSG